MQWDAWTKCEGERTSEGERTDMMHVGVEGNVAQELNWTPTIFESTRAQGVHALPSVELLLHQQSTLSD